MNLFLNKKSGRSPSSTTPPVKGCTPICVPARQNPGRAIKVRNHAGQSAGCIPAVGCSANAIGIVSNSGYRYPHVIPTGCGEMKDIYRIRSPTGPLASAINRSDFARKRSVYIYESIEFRRFSYSSRLYDSAYSLLFRIPLQIPTNIQPPRYRG